MRVRIAYADPPYPGCSHRYKGHDDYAGEVDHVALCRRLCAQFDGFILHTSSPAVVRVGALVPGARCMAWVKPFAAFKRHVPVAYAWEPVFVQACRKPVDLYPGTGAVTRAWADWCSARRSTA